MSRTDERHVKTLSLARAKTTATRLIAGVLICALGFTTSFTATGFAFADVRKADVILGTSVDARGLSVSQCPDITAEYAALTDSEGTVYFERSATTSANIASVTKIMTAIVALDNALPESQITVSSKAAAVGESSAHLQSGDVLTLEDALKALLLPSGNDAAVAIAETIGQDLMAKGAEGQDAEQVFVDAMNNKATELGLVNTVFSNPHGLDDGVYESDQHSSALDVATMAAYAMKNDVFRAAVTLSDASISVMRSGSLAQINITSTNYLLTSYEGTLGIKTGYTESAGWCFAGAVNKNGKEYYVSVLSSASEQARFTDATSLFDWVEAHQIDYPLVNTTEYVFTDSTDSSGQSTEVGIVAKVAHADWTDTTINATLSDPEASISVFDLNGNVSQVIEYDKITGNVSKGDKLGVLTFKQRNVVIATFDIVAAEGVEAPDFFEGIGIWWDRLFKSIFGGQDVAENVLLNQTPLVVDIRT
jgi:D-alanyl-D-alanine carboxypeptidase (penicillin-binding protein 5/6)